MQRSLAGDGHRLTGTRVAPEPLATHTGGERAEAAQLDTIALSQGQGDPLEHGIDDPLDVAQVEMGMGIGKPIAQIRSGHAEAPLHRFWAAAAPAFVLTPTPC